MFEIFTGIWLLYRMVQTKKHPEKIACKNCSELLTMWPEEVINGSSNESQWIV